MLNKQYRLPKEFADKWLEALRSGEYVQGKGALASFEKLESDVTKRAYCCLGVAAKIYDFDDVFIVGNSFLYNYKLPENKIPQEICGNPFDNKLVKVLSSLNDGIDLRTYTLSSSLYDSVIFRDETPKQVLKDSKAFFKLNFEQIANLIEDNCEFY